MNGMAAFLRRVFGVVNVLPLSEHERSVEVERTMAKVRVGAVALYAGSAAVQPGDAVGLTWAIFLVLCAGAAIGVAASRHEERSSFGRSAMITALDFVVFLAILGNNLSDPQDVVYIAGVLIVLEGALRWARRGGVVVGAAVAAAVGTWTVHIGHLADLSVPAEQPVLRGGSILVIGWAIGAVVANLQGQQVALQLALDSANDPMLTIDTRGAVLSANDAAAGLFHRPPEALVGLAIADLLTADGSTIQLTDLLGPADATRSTEYELTLPGRSPRWVEVQIIPIADLGISYARCRDITTRLETTKRLAHLAHHDPLTDLPNRRHLVADLGRVLDGPDSGTTLVYIDLDGFKSVNDTLGHDAGDALLCQAADRMRDCVRDSDLVARLAGDEFCIVLRDAEPGAVQAITERLRGCLREPFSVPGGDATIAASIGAVRHCDGEDPDELLRRADRAMYEAKSAGGDRVHPPGIRSVS